MLALALAASCGSPAGDAISGLPGFGRPPTPMWSGYLDASAAADGTHLFYWFAQSTRADWASAPVVLWLNGGPGSSSVCGMLMEAGPLLLDKHGALLANPYAWTSAANFLVLESPAGVGHSYCKEQLVGGPCINTDNSTASAAHAALATFFTHKFPELAPNKLYLTGESYAGVYIPTLAERIFSSNREIDGEIGEIGAGSGRRINLVGLAVGDPCTDNEAQAQSMDRQETKKLTTRIAPRTHVTALAFGALFAFAALFAALFAHTSSTPQSGAPESATPPPPKTHSLWFANKYGLIAPSDFDLLWNKCGVRFPSLAAVGEWRVGQKGKEARGGMSHRRLEPIGLGADGSHHASYHASNYGSNYGSNYASHHGSNYGSNYIPSGAVGASGYRGAHGPTAHLWSQRPLVEEAAKEEKAEAHARMCVAASRRFRLGTSHSLSQTWQAMGFPAICFPLCPC